MESPLHHFELHPIVHLSVGGLDISINKAIIAMFTESNLRLSELVGVKSENIDWENGITAILIKLKDYLYFF